ncbi:MAG: hypothetical protein IT424_09375 [Pirellulales bacterium]|nr:hypothetical protein [Pirellulales bacterium]
MRHLAAIVVLVLLLPIAQLTAPSAEAAISVVSEETESRFPSGLVFRVRATADQSITDIQVNLIIGRERVSSYGRPEFGPGREVSAEYTLRTGADRYIPPMSQITYWYQLKDAGGAQMETPRQTIR